MMPAMRSTSLCFLVAASLSWLVSCSTTESATAESVTPAGDVTAGDVAASTDTTALADSAAPDDGLGAAEDTAVAVDVVEPHDMNQMVTDTSSAADAATAADTAPDPDTTAVEAKYQAITAETLHTWLEAKDFLLINVHVPYEGDLPNTDANIAYTNLVGLVNALDKDLGKKAVLYCLTGPMSTKAVNDLVQLGYYNIYDLTGGMNAWKAAGFTLEQNPQ